MDGLVMVFELVSTAFVNTGRIPDKFTCNGHNVVPHLEWRGVPSGVKSFALVVDDPDAPEEIIAGGIWDHWIVFNIDGAVTKIEEGVDNIVDISPGSIVLNNSWHKKEYGGPCPPHGKEHRYFFKLYALSDYLDIGGDASKAELMSEISKYLIAKTELVGIYST